MDRRFREAKIKDCLQLMMNGGAEKSYVTHLEYAEGANVRVDSDRSLIKDLFLLTQLTEKSIPMNVEPIDVSHCCHHIKKIKRWLPVKKG